MVIHVLAEAATLTAEGTTPAYLPGYGTMPPAMLRDMAANAKLRPLDPSLLGCAEPHYRPSPALAEFIRCRDLHCRFPGCDKPAEYCDIDHTVPWQTGGPTHPSNLALLCRAHHLLKTFWTGETGWGEKQSSDGTITWTSPTGRTYTTTPGGALFFPQLGVSTGELSLQVRQPDNGTDRTLMMPTRRRTRAAERAARIQWERGLQARRGAGQPTHRRSRSLPAGPIRAAPASGARSVPARPRPAPGPGGPRSSASCPACARCRPTIAGGHRIDLPHAGLGQPQFVAGAQRVARRRSGRSNVGSSTSHGHPQPFGDIGQPSRAEHLLVAVDLQQRPQRRRRRARSPAGRPATAAADSGESPHHPADRHLEDLLGVLLRRHGESLAEIHRRASSISRSGTSLSISARTKPTRATGAAHRNTLPSESA